MAPRAHRRKLATELTYAAPPALVVAQLCTACPVPPGGVERWPTSQKEGCSGWHSDNCLWGGVCSRGDVYNGCLEYVFGYGIERFLALEGGSRRNQQWIVRRGVVGSTLFE